MIRQLSLLTLLLLVLMSTGLAQPGLPERAGQRMERRHEFRDQLNLSEDQEVQMKRIHLDLEKKQAQLQPKIHLARIAMKEAMLADRPDRSVFEKNIKAITDLQLEMKMNKLDHWFKVYALLTPDQQKIWKARFGEERMMDGDGPMRMRLSPGGSRGPGN